MHFTMPHSLGTALSPKKVLGALSNLVEATRNVRALHGVSDASEQKNKIVQGNGHAACCAPVAAS